MRQPLVRAWEHAVRVVVCGTVSLATCGVVLAHQGWYVPAVVVPVVLVATAALWWAWTGIQPEVVDPEDRGIALLVGVLGIIGVTVFHALHSGHYLFATRDPAFYTLMGLDMAGDGDLVVGGRPPLIGGIEDLRFQAQGFTLADDGSLAYAQGFHGLSALTAPGRWISESVFFRMAPLLGGACLLVFRRIAVRFSSPWIATALTLALGLSLPFAVFTRDAYSEIAALLFVLGALLLLVEGPPSTRRLLLAGVVAGAIATARIDALIMCGGIVLAITGVVLVTGRGLRWRDVAAVALGMGSTLTIGFVVGATRSPQYFADLSTQFRQSVLLFVASVAGAVVIVVVWTFLRRRVDRLEPHRDRVADVAAVVVVGVGVGLWLVAPMVLELERNSIGLVEGLQGREGLDLQPARTYGEQTLLRLAWAYGDVVVLAAIIGAGVAVRSVVRELDARRTTLLLLAATSVPYLLLPRITPDMPWALRRYFPVIIPILLLLAAIAFETLRRRHPDLRFALVPLLVIVVLAPARALEPVGGIRDSVPVAAFVHDICGGLDEDDTLFIGAEGLANVGTSAFATLCDATVVGVAKEEGDRAAALVDQLAETLQDEPGELLAAVPPSIELGPGVAVLDRREVAVRAPYVRNTLSYLPNTEAVRNYTVDVIRVRSTR